MGVTLAVRQRLEHVAERTEALVDGAALRQGHPLGVGLALPLAAGEVGEAELAVEAGAAAAGCGTRDKRVDEEVRAAALGVHAGAPHHLQASCTQSGAWQP